MSPAYLYLTRIIPALSVIGVVGVLIFAFVLAPYGKIGTGGRHGEATRSQLFLSVYTCALHVLSIMFPSRVCWALGDIIKKMKEVASMLDQPEQRITQIVKNDRLAATYPVPLFVVILPAYKEERETLEETLRVLASHPQARRCYDVYLAMEEKEEKAAVKAASLVSTFQKSFHRMSFTIHPAGIPGEAQGKSSNESWAAKKAFKDYPGELKKNVIMTIMDADTHLSPRYFAQVARDHLACPEDNQTVIYVPPIVFDRNLHHVPLPVRTADLMWAGAGLSSLYSGTPICIPTSVYSLPMTLAESVGGWDTGPCAIGEDMHMYLKCFFALSGNLKPQIVYAAASQCNVSSNLQSFNGYLDGLKARYKQALRHMWGSLDTGFAVREFVRMVGRHSRMDKSSRASTQVARFKGCVLNCLSAVTGFDCSTAFIDSDIRKPVVSAPVEPAPPTRNPINFYNVFIIFYRLFEAHFLPIHLAMILTTAMVYEKLCGGDMIPRELQLALWFSSVCRWIGWSLVCLFFYRYEKYHRLCLSLRKKEMLKAGMLEDIIEHDGLSPKVFPMFGVLESGLFPIGGFMFGAIPACQAVLSHFFTDRLTYQVSLKPQFNIKRWREIASSSSNPIRAPKSSTSHSRVPSDSWRKQALSGLDHVTNSIHWRTQFDGAKRKI